MYNDKKRRHRQEKLQLRVREVAKVKMTNTWGKRNFNRLQCEIKGLSVLWSKLLDQFLQGGKLSPVNEIELLTKGEEKC